MIFILLLSFVATNNKVHTFQNLNINITDQNDVENCAQHKNVMYFNSNSVIFRQRNHILILTLNDWLIWYIQGVPSKNFKI